MSEEEFDEPELSAIEGSEISGIVDLAAMCADHVYRPVFINQTDENFLSLTLEDAERLLEFLSDATIYLKDIKTRITN